MSNQKYTTGRSTGASYFFVLFSVSRAGVRIRDGSGKPKRLFWTQRPNGEMCLYSNFSRWKNISSAVNTIIQRNCISSNLSPSSIRTKCRLKAENLLTKHLLSLDDVNKVDVLCGRTLFPCIVSMEPSSLYWVTLERVNAGWHHTRRLHQMCNMALAQAFLWLYLMQNKHWLRSALRPEWGGGLILFLSQTGHLV